MKQYLDALRYVLDNGTRRGDRTGVGTISAFDCPTMVYDLQKGFPLVTTKKMFLRGVIEELLWFLRGSTNVRELQEKDVHIWDGNYEAFRKKIEEEAAHFGCLPDLEEGDLGPIYGHQWRRWDCPNYGGYSASIDQISSLVSMIKNTPTSRRLIVSAWNVAQLEEMALPPCHVLFQCYVRDGYLDLKLYQRSADMFLGVPFNISSYSLLLMMLAQQTDLMPGKFIHVIGDAHVYTNHIDQVRLQLERTPHTLPTMEIDKAEDIFSYTIENFHLKDYECDTPIKAPMAV